MADTAARKPRRLRRFAIAAGTASALAVGTVIMLPGTSSAATTLGGAAALSNRFFGASVIQGHLGESDYAATLHREFSIVTPENEMKWQNVEPNEGQFSFGSADAIVNDAMSHGQRVRGHTLVWHSQLAGWVSNKTTSATLTAAMNNHINGVMAHYKGKITYWDVVNEAFQDGGPARRSSPFQNIIGDGFIETAFRTARAADPAAKLCYNDFNIDGMNSKSNAVFAMVQDFKSRGVPIDCVGFQGHFNSGTRVTSDIQANYQRFANLGVDVNITELDIEQSSGDQATLYRNVINACIAVARCTSITVWGVTDKYSWRASATPLPIDGNFQPKPAYTAILAALNAAGPNQPPPSSAPPSQPPPSSNPPSSRPPASSNPPSSPGSPGGCSVLFNQNPPWNTGYTVNMRITNSGSTAINGWSLVFTLASGQTITSGWNATYSPTSGQVTATNVSYNATIPAGGSVGDFGFQASHTGNSSKPTAFSLNGRSCTVL